ncbi:MAG: nuclear transport factor 2 family protein [Parvularculaceae bacterium]|nr:nuclear transport factor 2 family protein [Parvularculaceae bacterium]
MRDWASAGEQGRWDDLKSLYDAGPGFVWIEQGRIAYPDHAAVVAGVEAAKAAKAEIRSTISDVVVTPLAADAAAFHARSTMTVASPSFRFAFDGILSGVAVKRDGAWKLLQGHLSAPPPQADAPPAE